jgi:predicted DCC family thiol-disulfide oxidoreductase YuxK
MGRFLRERASRSAAHDAKSGPPLVVDRTTPPGRHVVLYDGRCRFCTAGVKRLLRLARPGMLEAVNFQEPGALDRFPGVPYEACMRRMYLVTPEGRLVGGFEAAVQALGTRPVIGKPAYLYYVPGLRWLCDALYALIAAYRYRIMGRTAASGGCNGDACALHLGIDRSVSSSSAQHR